MMGEKSDNHPFYAWIPKPVGIVILLLIVLRQTGHTHQQCPECVAQRLECFGLSAWFAALLGAHCAQVTFPNRFFVAFLLMAIANGYFYFQYQTEGLFRNMALSTVLNAVGLLMLYAVVAAWGMKGLPSRYLSTFVFLMIWMRNAIAPVVGSSVYTNLLYHRQQDYVTRFVQNVDAENPLAQATFVQMAHMGKAMGGGTTEAAQLATTSLKGRIAKQATISAMKDVTGQTVICLLGIMVLVVFLPYRKNEST